ncbi:MAG: type II toxin-antitoxin system VapC family toxin [Nanoarchaeota archaeon]
MKFYLDTSIWIDLYEDRKGYSGEKLGDFAWKLFSMIKNNGFRIIISDMLILELEQKYSMAEIKGMIKLFETSIDKVLTTKEERNEAHRISQERNLPSGDVLHAILARNHKFILVTRDNHFRKLTDICSFHKPEEFI